MRVTARKLGESSNLICNITPFAILIYELFGPGPSPQQALIHSGDIQPMSEEVRNRRQIESGKRTEAVISYRKNEYPAPGALLRALFRADKRLCMCTEAL